MRELRYNRVHCEYAGKPWSTLVPNKYRPSRDIKHTSLSKGERKLAWYNQVGLGVATEVIWHHS